MTAVWFAILAFGLGVLVGIMVDDVYEMLSGKKLKMPFSTPAHRKMSLFLIVALIGNLLVGGLLIYTRLSADRYFQCIAQWQQEFSAGYQARYKASVDADKATADSWDALDNVINAIKPGNQDAFQQTLDSYREFRVDQRAEAQRQIKAQKDNPPPELPSEQCGNPKEVRR